VRWPTSKLGSLRRPTVALCGCDLDRFGRSLALLLKKSEQFSALPVSWFKVRSRLIRARWRSMLRRPSKRVLASSTGRSASTSKPCLRWSRLTNEWLIWRSGA
jgi:hypothetical protein